MDVELIPETMPQDENYAIDDNNNNHDYSNFEGERCGICMDIVVDRGVLDCCQHWFCFTCIDNWATITSLCPLCQNEFQLITCVPLYDTIGGNKTDEDLYPRYDDWNIEGKTNTLAFPSYYIDENAVVCLDGDRCKIRSGSVAVGEDLDVDTSIACDMCDKWYHAFCVGFDTENTYENSWLCPRCVVDKMPQKSDSVSLVRQTDLNGLQNVNGDGDSSGEASFSGRLSVSVPDPGETDIVISLLDGNQRSQEASANVPMLDSNNDESNQMLPSSISDIQDSAAPSNNRNSVQPNSREQELELSLSRDSCCRSIQTVSPDDEARKGQKLLDTLSPQSGSYLSLCLSVGLSTTAKDQAPQNVKLENGLEECLLSVDQPTADRMEMTAVDSIVDDKKEVMGATGAKRKHKDVRNPDDAVRKAKTEAKFPKKKLKPDRENDSRRVPSLSTPQNEKLRHVAETENRTDDIMDIVQGTNPISLKQIAKRTSSDMSSRENATGLRLKKIMRRAEDDKDSSVTVQKLRKEIRDAVRNKSSAELGKNLFDPKLLDAFRAALAGSISETKKPPLHLKAKKSLLQKGKIRESLTKKIYGIGGKRKRAWTRDCEIEFWKHRCLKATKPEKIQTLKSVLDLLRNDPGGTEKMSGNEGETTGSILSRLYLADASVFPRKDDIKPVSVAKAAVSPGEKNESGLAGKFASPPSSSCADISPANNDVLAQATVPPLTQEMKKNITAVKAQIDPSKAQKNKHTQGSSIPTLISTKVPNEKETVGKSDNSRVDKRKWALEVLARRKAAARNAAQDHEEDNSMLKESYPLLAQLPKDMLPVLAPSQHNKIPMSVRQAQLYRLTEHFLKKANLPVIRQTAETELAVADAVNIEKEVADRSQSKLVYINLCSQELLRRSDNLNFDRATESNTPEMSEVAPDCVTKEAHNCSLDTEVDEALRAAGLISNSPPGSPNHLMENVMDGVGSAGKADDDPDNIFEVDSHPELDIYGDFEYNLEEDDFLGAGALKISELHPEESKLKVVFSTMNLEKSEDSPDLMDHKRPANIETLDGSSESVECQTIVGCSSLGNSRIEDCPTQNSSVGGDEELSPTECEELYGPDKEPLFQKYPETALGKSYEQMIQLKCPEDREDHGCNQREKECEKENDGCVENPEVSMSKTSPQHPQKTEDAPEKEKLHDTHTKKQADDSSSVSKKVEAYIKEHIRPLCKSGVITVEQYRWAVGKTTEKVMKYHTKEKNANFLIKEGEKVKKLAEQYVEAAHQKAKK